MSQKYVTIHFRTTDHYDLYLISEYIPGVLHAQQVTIGHVDLFDILVQQMTDQSSG